MTADDVRRVARRVRCLIDLNETKLGDEFFPAHLSIALIDALFTANREYALVVPIVERYCQRFSLNRVRQDRTTLPPAGEQETLSDLVGHYETLGLDELQETVFRVRWPAHPSTKILRSENVRRAAIALRDIGVETLEPDPKRVERFQGFVIQFGCEAERSHTCPGPKPPGGSIGATARVTQVTSPTENGR